MRVSVQSDSGEIRCAICATAVPDAPRGVQLCGCVLTHAFCGTTCREMRFVVCIEVPTHINGPPVTTSAPASVAAPQPVAAPAPAPAPAAPAPAPAPALAARGDQTTGAEEAPRNHFKPVRMARPRAAVHMDIVRRLEEAEEALRRQLAL